MRNWEQVKKSWYKYRKVYISMIFGAIILPVLSVAVVNNQDWRLFSLASEAEPVRVWMEPAMVVAKINQPVNYKVMAEYSDPTKIIPNISVEIKADGLEIAENIVVYSRAFKGQVEIGTIEVTAKRLGKYTLEILENSVDTSLPDLPVITGGAYLNVD